MATALERQIKLVDLADVREVLRVCAWCRPGSPAVDVAVVWEHPDVPDCWCGDRAHVSWACPAHLEREVADLRSLGFVPVAVIGPAW